MSDIAIRVKNPTKLCDIDILQERHDTLRAALVRARLQIPWILR